MEKMLPQIQNWLDKDHSTALATVIKTWGSSPRPAGAVMAISGESEISGSVSGGCVEGAVLEAGLEVIRKNEPVRLHFGVADQDAWQVGLSCGGEIEIFLHPFTAEDLDCWKLALDRKRAFCRLLVIEGGAEFRGQEWFIFEDGELIPHSSAGSIPQELIQAGTACLTEEAGRLNFPGTAYEEVFYQVIWPASQLVIVGGVHIAIPLASLADVLGYDVVVIDPRRLFGTEHRFPEVKMLLQMWPQEAFDNLELTESSAVVMLTHDPKIDDPAITAALRSPAFYVGALGSRKTHQKRLQRLREKGLAPQLLKRIHAPVGLNLGGSSPEEIALAVMAEIVQTRYSKGSPE